MQTDNTRLSHFRIQTGEVQHHTVAHSMPPMGSQEQSHCGCKFKSRMMIQNSMSLRPKERMAMNA